MNRKIIRIGNSYGVIIPKNILKILGWDVRELEAKLDTKKGELIIKKGRK
jgi:antitoxin component of MazEF toxin-antitoxin module